MNFTVVKTLAKREINRFLGIYNQTILAPSINAFLLFIIFSISSKNGQDQTVRSLSAAGLVAMVAMQNAFANSQSSISLAKVLGFIIDYIMPPISYTERICSIVLASVLRGILSAVPLFVVLLFFVKFDITIYRTCLLFLSIVIGSIIFGMLGIIIGCVSSNFDTAQAYTTYIITPFTFLSGTFYSIKNLPHFWQVVMHFNPVFYLIDLVKFSLTGILDSNLFLELFVSACFLCSVSVACFYVISKKYTIIS